MNYQEQINRYFDGGLDPISEQILFVELAKNPELRSEFNAQIKLQSLFQLDMQSLTPPAELTKTVFNDLGFVPPVQRDENNRKYALLLILLISIGVMTATYFTMFNNSIQNNQSNQNSISVAQSKNINIPVVSSEDDKSILNKELSLYNQNISHSKVGKFEKNRKKSEDSVKPLQNSSRPKVVLQSKDDENIVSEDLSNKMFLISDSPVSFIPLDNAITFKQQNSFTVYSSDLGDFDTNENLNQFKDYAVEIRGLNTRPDKQALQQMFNPAMGQNWNASFVYRLDENHSFIAEFGYENFVIQTMMATDSKAFFWIGPSYRYTFTNFTPEDFVSPYFQVTAAASEGLIGRTQIGLDINPLSSFSMLIGYEASALIRGTANGNQYVKNGFVMGLAFRF